MKRIGICVMLALVIAEIVVFAVLGMNIGHAVVRILAQEPFRYSYVHPVRADWRADSYQFTKDGVFSQLDEDVNWTKRQMSPIERLWCPEYMYDPLDSEWTPFLIHGSPWGCTYLHDGRSQEIKVTESMFVANLLVKLRAKQLCGYMEAQTIFIASWNSVFPYRCVSSDHYATDFWINSRM